MEAANSSNIIIAEQQWPRGIIIVVVVCLKKNLNASRPSEHLLCSFKEKTERMYLDVLSIPQSGGNNVKTFRWDHRLQRQTCCFLALSVKMYWLITRKNYFTRWPIPLVCNLLERETISSFFDFLNNVFLSVSPFLPLNLVLRRGFSRPTRVALSIFRLWAGTRSRQRG